MYAMDAPISNETDEHVARRVQSGDTEAFGELVQRYEQKMLRYARRFLFGVHDAEDVVQDVFIKAYVNIQSFDATRRFSPWLYRIAHNEFVNALKKRRGEAVPFFDPATLFPQPVSPSRADDELSARELREMLDQGLQQLDLKYREPLVLYYFEELSYQEIAEVLHLPPSTVGVRLSRGRAAIAKFINLDAYEPNRSTITAR